MGNIFTELEVFLQLIKDYVEKVKQENICHDVEYFCSLITWHRKLG
jgi:hypothetical protein